MLKKWIEIGQHGSARSEIHWHLFGGGLYLLHDWRMMGKLLMGDRLWTARALNFGSVTYVETWTNKMIDYCNACENQSRIWSFPRSSAWLSGHFDKVPVLPEPFTPFMFYLANIWTEMSCIDWKLSLIGAWQHWWRLKMPLLRRKHVVHTCARRLHSGQILNLT